MTCKYAQMFFLLLLDYSTSFHLFYFLPPASSLCFFHLYPTSHSSLIETFVLFPPLSSFNFLTLSYFYVIWIVSPSSLLIFNSSSPNSLNFLPPSALFPPFDFFSISSPSDNLTYVIWSNNLIVPCALCVSHIGGKNGASCR